MKKLISFAIPCYKSSNTILFVIDEIVSLFQSNDKYEYEIVTVVDGSPDNVFEVLKKAAANNPKIKVIDLSKNYGQSNAQMAALNYSDGDYVVCLDDDGQCPVDKSFELIYYLEKGFDMAAARYPQKKQSVFKNFGSYVNRVSSRILLDVSKDFYTTNFFAIKSFVVKQIREYKNPYPYISGLLSQITRNIRYVTMEERERISGRTGYTFLKLLSLWLNGFTAFSVKPLRISSLIGVLCAIIGFTYGVIIIIRKLAIPDISVGWSSTVAIMLFIGGLIMLMLGMIGEYIGRIYISINNAPQYVVRETINVDGDENE